MSSISLASQNENLKQRKATIQEGVARLTFDTNIAGNTRLKNLYQSDPQRVLFPNSPDKDIIQAAVVNISGGLVGGDKLSTRVKVNKNASVFVVGQSAEKVYRSNGADSEIEINLTVENGGWLEFLPQETILFNGSRLRRRTHINIEGDAELIVGELLVFGRLGHGERFQSGLIHDAWEITRDGILIWADALHMQDDIASTIADPACFDGAVSMATIVYAGIDIEYSLSVARGLISNKNPNVLTGVTCVNEIIIIRWLGRDVLELRNDFGAFWCAFRNQTRNLPENLPRLWSV